jgi:hypothetical protein
MVAQTYSVDIDEGQLSTGADADVWFQAVTMSQLFLKPVNGAQLAVGDRSDRGRRRCATESFSNDPVALNALPVGSFVCVATNRGRVAQFRVSGVSGGVPKTLTLDYTTWE